MKMRPAPCRLPLNASTMMQTQHCPAILVRMTEPWGIRNWSHTSSVTRSLSLEKRRAHGATYVPNFLFQTRVLLPSIRCSINMIISWHSDNLRRRWERQRSLFAILIWHKCSEKSKSIVPKLGQHSGFWKPELNGQTALSHMLAWLRKQHERICKPQARPLSFGTIAWSGEHWSFRSLPKSCFS